MILRCCVHFLRRTLGCLASIQFILCYSKMMSLVIKWVCVSFNASLVQFCSILLVVRLMASIHLSLSVQSREVLYEFLCCVHILLRVLDCLPIGKYGTFPFSSNVGEF